MKNPNIERVIKTQKDYLQRLDENIESILQDSPDQKLNIHKRAGMYRFELRSKSSPDQPVKSVYINRTSKEFKIFAAQYCALSLRPAVKKALIQLDKKPGEYDPYHIPALIKHLEDVFGDDVPDCFETREHYIERWKKASFRKNPYPLDPTRSYTTERGEIVRSKNELLCANFVYRCGLPYRVDAELIMKNGRSKYPDIIILNPKTLQEEYHEIMGRMSDPGYVDDNLIKLREYEASEYHLGDRLHVYFESEKIPFDFNFFKSEIQRLYLNP